MIHPTYPSSPGPFNVYQEHASANSKQHMHSSDVVSSQVVLDVDDWSSITISPNQDYFEWNHHKYHLELNYLQAYRGVLLVALRKLEESHTGASPLAIRVTGNLARKLLPSGQLPEPSYSTYLGYREEVVREMYHMLKYEKSPTDTVVTQPHGSPYTNVAALVSPHRPHSAPVERVIITNPMDVAIQQPFILYRGCQYRLRYDLSAELKAIPTNTIDAMIKFNPHLYECDPPAVIKVVGFIASQVAPENFVRSSSQYIAYRTEVIEMLPSLVSIPVDKGNVKPSTFIMNHSLHLVDRL
jgi:hypothetical protein